MRYQFYHIKGKPKLLGGPPKEWVKVTDEEVIEIFGGPQTGVDPQRLAASLDKKGRNTYGHFNCFRIEKVED